MPTDTYASSGSLRGLNEPASNAFAITPSDTVDFSYITRGIYVGTTGNVVAIVGGTAITFVGVPAGMTLPVRASRVNSTNTTASNLVGLY